MKRKIILSILVSSIFLGCSTEPTPGDRQDPCAESYEECMEECKIITESDSDFQKSLCHTKCSIGYGSCSAFGKTANSVSEFGKTLKKKFIDKEE